MIKTIKGVLGILALFCTTPLVAQDKSFHHAIEKIIRHETKIDFGLVPTIVIWSVDVEHGLNSLDTFGSRISRDQGRIYPRVWELGSLSKPFIAFLARRALDTIGLSENSDVCSVLPDSLCHDHWAGLTFKQILEHRAGLPMITSQMAKAENDVQDPYKNYGLLNLERDILEVNPTPGDYSFSHLGYAALYWLFAQVGGLKTFAQLQFPAHDSIRVWEEIPDSLLVPGHGLNGKSTAAWHANALTSAIGLKSDMPSVYRFISKWFPGGGTAYLIPDPELRKELDLLDKKKEFKIDEGWFVWRSGTSILYYMNGHTGGHAVSVAFVPAEAKAVLVFANGAAGTQDLSLLILDMLRKGKKK